MSTVVHTFLKRSCIKAAWLTPLFAALFVLGTTPARAQCDTCVTAAVGAAATLITSTIAQLELTLYTQLDNIGNAIASLITANTASLQSLQVANQKGFELVVKEDHARASKESSLEVKRDINESFGAIAWNHCFEVETTMGVVDTHTDAYEQALFSAKAFSGDIKNNTKSPALRRRIMEEYFPEAFDVGRYFSSHHTLNHAEMLHVPALTHVLSQSVVLPIAPTKGLTKENDRTRYYRELKRERDAHGAIVEDALARAILTNAPVVEAGEYVQKTLEEAGIDPSAYVDGGFTSESGLIKAIGHSAFGNVATVRHSAISGEELMRVLISEVGKTNYVLSKQYEALKDLRFLHTLSFGKAVETFYEVKLEQAFQQLN